MRPSNSSFQPALPTLDISVSGNYVFLKGALLIILFFLVNVALAQNTVYVDKNNNSVGIKEITLIVDKGGAQERTIVQTNEGEENPMPEDVTVEIGSILLENGQRIFATSRFPSVKSANPLLGSNQSFSEIQVVKYNHSDPSQHITHANNLENFLRAMEEVVSIPDLRSYWDISPTPILEENNAFVDIIYPNQIPSSGYMMIAERHGNSGLDLMPLDAKGRVIENAALVNVRAPFTWNTGVNHQINFPDQKQWLTLIQADAFQTIEPIYGFRVFDIMEADGKFIFFAREVSATPDNAGPVFGFSGGNNIINIFDNDELDGRPLDTSDITLTVIDIEGALASGFIILNQDPNSENFGAVSVAPGTPAGVYTFDYEITDKLDGRKDRATVTIRVTDPVDPEFDDCRESASFVCEENSFNVEGIYLSDSFGNKIESERCDFGSSSEVYVSVSLPNQFENTRFETRLLADLFIGDSQVPVKISAFLGTLNPNQENQIIRVISDSFLWNCGDVLSLRNILLIWRDNEEILNPVCEDYESALSECADEIKVQSPVINEESCIDAGRITGRIVNEQTGQPISGVPVVLSKADRSDGLKMIAITGNNGRYLFENLVFGKYLVQVQEANLNAVKGLFAASASEMEVTLDGCVTQADDFSYGTSNRLHLSGIVWYDSNGNGQQDEWFDANDDGQVTLNDPSRGAIDIRDWEWFDLNGDGRYDGPENYGELNIAGFGNSQSSNIKVNGPNGLDGEAMISQSGYWNKVIPENADFGDYTAQLVMDNFLNESAKNIGETGLIKTLPNLRVADFNNVRVDIQCGLTTPEVLTRELSRSIKRHIDLHFGIRCHEEFVEIIANDDEFGEHFVSFMGTLGNILDNDLLNGNPVTPDQVDFEFTELDGLIGLNIDENGELSLLIPGINPPGTYQLEYVLRENGFPENFDRASVTFTLLADNVDLAVEKTSNGVEIFEGDNFEYTVTVTNLGETNATNVEVIDILPSGVTYVSTAFSSSDNSVDVGIRVEGNRITYTIPSLSAGTVLTLTIFVQADAINGQNPLNITNQVTVSSAEEDFDMSNNSDVDSNVVNAFFIPNVITPNGDNKNDAFEIKGISKFASNDILIFNRYGDHVYEKSNYDNSWDAPGQVAGTYFYIFQGTDAAGRMHEFKGWIQVIKD